MIKQENQLSVLSLPMLFEGIHVNSFVSIEILSYVFTCILVVTFLLTFFLTVMRIAMSLLRGLPLSKVVTETSPSEFPKISIHIPFCNEPPDMVIATIKSCMAQQYRDFEIIVLSNNTEALSLWKPVEIFCSKYLQQIRFEHREMVVGFKGGALDFCRTLTGKDVKYIFTVDADYILNPFALRRAVRHLKYTDAHLLQFPQSYFKESENSQQGIHGELYSYFELYSRIGNLTGSAMPTGTLSLIRLDSLDQVNGWSCNSITEDANLGVALCRAGLRTYFIPEVLGSGRLPNSITDLLKQRSRWIFGNFQALKLGFKGGKVTTLSRLTVFLQLTAWTNFLAPALIFLLIQVLLWFLKIDMPIRIFFLAISCISMHLVAQLILLGISSGFAPKQWIGSFMTHAALLDLGAFQWIPAMFGVERPFICTDKFYKRGSVTEIPLLLPGLFMALYLISLTRGFVFGHLLLIPFIFFTVASLRLYTQFRIPNEILKNQLDPTCE